ncbi:single-stranded DNA-binding protein [Aegicerativicinus sediminis]|uniref:single-stranded DNA-binding protein n=1 Tax=Aegicerativicinus sediminis TaxID=2893202 RepID=UPI001E60A90E|nr:single-stranded DNA-binding protein [Aegicerativicinus sediminis]
MKQITIIGNLGADADLVLENNSYRLQIKVAVTEKYENSQGATVEKTDWFMVFKNYKNEPKKLMHHLTKGARVFVQGKPSFTLNTHNDKQYLNLSISCQILQLLTFND